MAAAEEKDPIALPNQIEPATIDPRVRPITWNKDGSYSTVHSMSFTDHDNKEVLIPTVIDQGKGAFIAEPRQAIEHYRKTGEHLGKFSHIEDGKDPGQMLHEALAAEYAQQYGDMNRLRPKDGSTSGQAPSIGTTKGYAGGKRAQLTFDQMMQLYAARQVAPYANNMLGAF